MRRHLADTIRNACRTVVALAAAALVLGPNASPAAAETIRIGVGTQDTTVNCAAGGTMVRELKLLEKHLPRDGKYAGAEYDIVWHNFTSGPPVTNEMVADKLDIGMMGDFPAILNGTTFAKVGKGVRSIYVATISGSATGGGNAIVVPADSPAQSIKDLKGKKITVPFGSAAHGMLLRATSLNGLDPNKDVQLASQSPEVGGSALRARMIDAHADFVPFGELFPFRGFARKVYDGSMGGVPTFHGIVVRSDFADKHPEIVVAYLKATIEAAQLYAAEPEKYSELMEKWVGINAEVNYMFGGPLAVQTRDVTIKPEFVAGMKSALDTLRLLKRATADGFDVGGWMDDKFIRQACREMNVDYDAALKNYDPLPIKGTDALTGESLPPATKGAVNLAQLWVTGEPVVRNYATLDNAFKALAAMPEDKPVRAFYVHDQVAGTKLLAGTSWYVVGDKGGASAFLLKESAEAYAKDKGGRVVNFDDARRAAAATAAPTATAG